MSDSTADLLGVITAALASASGPRADLPLLDEAAVRQVGPDADLVLLFADRAQAAGAEVHRVGAAELPDAVGSLLADYDLRHVLCHHGVTRAWSSLTGVLGRARCHPGAGDESLFDAQAGVTVAEWGVAETGSVVCTAAADRSGLTSLVPPLHLAVLDAGRIVPDLCDLFAALLPEKLAAALTLITGPSKTADIESILVTGMHGPGRLCVVLVEPAGSS